MSKWVLDSSAVLAVIFGEAGHEIAKERLLIPVLAPLMQQRFYQNLRSVATSPMTTLPTSPGFG